MYEFLHIILYEHNAQGEMFMGRAMMDRVCGEYRYIMMDKDYTLYKSG